MIEALGSLATGIGEAAAAVPTIGGEVGSAVSTAMPAAVVAPAASLGSEIGAAASIVAPGVEMSGGSLASGLDSTNLFSETVPFSASLASIPEMPIGSPKDIFSGSWKTLGEISKPSLVEVGSAPVVDVLKASDFVPMEPSVMSTPEMTIANPKEIFSDSWTTLGEIAKPSLIVSSVPEQAGTLGDSIIDKLISSEPPVPEVSAPEVPVEVNLSENEWLSLVEEPQAVEFAQTPVLVEPQVAVEGITDLQVEGLKALIESPVASDRVQALAEETVAQSQLAEKVVKLLVEEGVYSEPQARVRVGEIALERKGLSEDVVGEIEMTTEDKTQVLAAPTTETSVIQAKTAIGEIKVKTREDKRGSQPENSERRSFNRGVVVDGKAQASRRKIIGENILALFKRAKNLGLKKVNSREITERLEKKQENKSFLLTQLEIPHIPDGSLEEAARSIESLGEFEIPLDNDNGEMMSRVDGILAKNVPVEIANPNAKVVSEKDVKKVLKHVGERIASV